MGCQTWRNVGISKLASLSFISQLTAFIFFTLSEGFSALRGVCSHSHPLSGHLKASVGHRVREEPGKVSTSLASQSSAEFLLCFFPLISDKSAQTKLMRSSDISPEPEGEKRFPRQQQRHWTAASLQKHRLKSCPLIEPLREMLLVWKDLHN